MVSRPRIPDPVIEEARTVAEEHDYKSLGEAIRHMAREGGYNV